VAQTRPANSFGVGYSRGQRIAQLASKRKTGLPPELAPSETLNRKPVHLRVRRARRAHLVATRHGGEVANPLRRLNSRSESRRAIACAIGRNSLPVLTTDYNARPEPPR
jgi:hypothetical protein